MQRAGRAGREVSHFISCEDFLVSDLEPRAKASASGYTPKNLSILWLYQLNPRSDVAA
jgi:hypothetical protein